jgi:hypothetical protein
MLLGKEGGEAAVILRNRFTFWSSHPSRRQSRNIQGTDEGNQSGGAGESHPHAPTDPDVTVSRYPALIIQPLE